MYGLLLLMFSSLCFSLQYFSLHNKFFTSLVIVVLTIQVHVHMAKTIEKFFIKSHSALDLNRADCSTRQWWLKGKHNVSKRNQYYRKFSIVHLYKHSFFLKLFIECHQFPLEKGFTVAEVMSDSWKGSFIKVTLYSRSWL